MVLSLSITAFATGTGGSATGKGSITIKNTLVGGKYEIYKIFNASYGDKYNEDGSLAVSYTIKLDEPGCKTLFGEDGKTPNEYFTYNTQSGAVSKKEGKTDAEVIQYLTELVKGGVFGTAVATVDGTGHAVKVDNLPYGYYMVYKDANSLVTVDSNTPDAVVVDKNQHPGNILKEVESNGTYTNKNTANIGDEVHYMISFDATNANGSHQIRYYQVHDEKGTGLWADFNSIGVKLIHGDGENEQTIELKKGYYLNMAGANGESTWTTLGNWEDYTGTDEDKIHNADWYLVHLDTDAFRITIPWQEGHSIKEENGVYTIVYNEDGDFKYPSVVKSVITYSAAVEPGATLGGGSGTNLNNKARVSWTCAQDSHTTDFSEVVTETFGIGLLKDDAKTNENLAGAKFRLFDSNGNAVNVVPTKIDGVYMVDNAPDNHDRNAYARMDTPRELAGEARLKEYLGDDYANKHDNLVVSQLNGKVVVLGLKEGTYTLKEVEAPPSYNPLTEDVDVVVNGTNIEAFKVFADSNGKVANIQAAEGAYTENAYRVSTVNVQNSKGVELPSTGGEGAVLMITIGAVLACAFAVLLITQKKMSIYKD